MNRNTIINAIQYIFRKNDEYTFGYISSTAKNRLKEFEEELKKQKELAKYTVGEDELSENEMKKFVMLLYDWNNNWGEKKTSTRLSGLISFTQSEKDAEFLKKFEEELGVANQYFQTIAEKIAQESNTIKEGKFDPAPNELISGLRACLAVMRVYGPLLPKAEIGKLFAAYFSKSYADYYGFDNSYCLMTNLAKLGAIAGFSATEWDEYRKTITMLLREHSETFRLIVSQLNRQGASKETIIKTFQTLSLMRDSEIKETLKNLRSKLFPPNINHARQWERLEQTNVWKNRESTARIKEISARHCSGIKVDLAWEYNPKSIRDKYHNTDKIDSYCALKQFETEVEPIDVSMKLMLLKTHAFLLPVTDGYGSRKYTNPFEQVEEFMNDMLNANNMTAVDEIALYAVQENRDYWRYIWPFIEHYKKTEKPETELTLIKTLLRKSFRDEGLLHCNTLLEKINESDLEWLRYLIQDKINNKEEKIWEGTDFLLAQLAIKVSSKGQEELANKTICFIHEHESCKNGRGRQLTQNIYLQIIKDEEKKKIKQGLNSENDQQRFIQKQMEILFKNNDKVQDNCYTASSFHNIVFDGNVFGHVPFMKEPKCDAKTMSEIVIQYQNKFKEICLQYEKEKQELEEENIFLKKQLEKAQQGQNKSNLNNSNTFFEVYKEDNLKTGTSPHPRHNSC